jgi:hypothetical protein
VDDEPLRAVCEKKAFQCTRDPSAETRPVRRKRERTYLHGGDDGFDYFWHTGRPDPYLGLGFVCHPEEVVVVDAELTRDLLPKQPSSSVGCKATALLD